MASMMKLLGLVPKQAAAQRTVPSPEAKAYSEAAPPDAWLRAKLSEFNAVFPAASVEREVLFGVYLQAAATVRLADEIREVRLLLASGEGAFTVSVEQHG